MSCFISPAAAQAPTAPPGLPAAKNGWESNPPSYLTRPPGLAVPGNDASKVRSGPDRAGNLSAASWGSAGASASSPDSDSGPDLTTATESDNPYHVHIHFSESMEEEFHGMRIRDMEDEDELRELDAIAPGVWQEPTGWEMTGGWDDDALDAEDHWQQTQETTVKPVLCDAHGIICKKGICAEYARQLRLSKRADEAEKRKAAAGANKGKKGGRGKGRGAGKKNDENENEEESTRKNANQNNPFRGPGAPVKTNWRGAPRAIVSADTIEKRETTKAVSDDEWGNSDSEVEPNAAAVVPAGIADAASDASWGISEGAYDPWARTSSQQVRPATKANHSGAKPQGKKTQKPAQGQTTAASSWADQVDAELAAGDGGSKRRSKRGTSSTTSWGTGTAKSSTSGWGSVADMPW